MAPVKQVATDQKSDMKNPLADQPGYALKRASGYMLSRLNTRLAALDLRHAEAAVMVMISENSGVTPSDLGRMLGIQSANMAPLITRLFKRDLLVKKPLDRKSYGLHLSPKGEEVAAKASEAMDAEENYLKSLIPKDLLPIMTEALSRIWREP